MVNLIEVLKRFSALTFIVGAVFIVIAASGGLSVGSASLDVSEQLWRMGLGAIGIILLLASGLVFRLENATSRNAQIKMPGPFKPGTYPVSIAAPAPGTVNPPIIVTCVGSGPIPDDFQL
jgi:hypothetical protein